MAPQEVAKRVRRAHGDTVRLVESSFVGFKRHAIFEDRDYGLWRALVYAVCRGTRHPRRARLEPRNPGAWKGVQLSPAELHSRFDRKFGEGLIRVVPETYRGLNQRCTMLDAEYGEFVASPNNVLKGLGHPQRWNDTRAARFRKSLPEVQREVLKASCGKVQLVGEYLGMLRKTLFQDTEFGEFEAFPVNVIHHKTRHPAAAPGRREAAFIRRFGVKHHMQDNDQFAKYLHSRARRYFERHWSTGEEVVCIGTYELKTVRHWNHHKVSYLWQPRAFVMPDGHTYRPDAYLIDQNLWVEVKGLFQDSGKAKWDWFHREYPNSELWDKERLRGLGILPTPKRHKPTTPRS